MSKIGFAPYVSLGRTWYVRLGVRCRAAGQVLAADAVRCKQNLSKAMGDKGPNAGAGPLSGLKSSFEGRAVSWSRTAIARVSHGGRVIARS